MENQKSISFGAGCFWGVEHAFKQLEGVLSTSVGFQGGQKKMPTYEEVCAKDTGHVEVVKVDFDASILPVKRILEAFFFMHDPTQENRQGPDVGPQYRSALFCFDSETFKEVKELVALYKEAFLKANPNQAVTTTVDLNEHFFAATPEHQDYLVKNPTGYCHIGFDTFQKLKLGQF